MAKTNYQDDNYLKRELYDRIQKDNKILEFIQEGSLDGVWYWDLENQENEWMSPRFWELFGYEPAEKKHNPAEWQDMINPDDLKTVLENFHKHLEDPSHPYDQEVRYRHKDGHTVWVRCRGLAIRDENGKPIRMLGAHNDLTSLKEKEAELEILIREMNHRIKNNLSMISSLISLKEMSLKDDTFSRVFEEIQNNIDAVGMVHQKLYCGANLSDINIEEYCLDLLSKVFSNYNNGTVKIESKIDEFKLDTGKATIIGLILNETALNAMKHGFTPDTAAVFRVTASCKTAEKKCILSIENNGRTFPASFDIENAESFGLKMLKTFTVQLKGSLRLEREPQTKFIIDFQTD